MDFRYAKILVMAGGLIFTTILLLHLPAVKSYEYDVFLSFRGIDTRKGFTYKLYKAFINQSGIHIFRDDTYIRPGDDIQSAIERGMRESEMIVAVISENYASSAWCLDELAMAMKPTNSSGQIVVPVFYLVDPSDVAKLTGTFAEAIAKLEKQFEQAMEKWKAKLLISTLVPSDIKEKTKELLAEIEKPFKETLEGWREAWRETINIRRTGTSDIKKVLENYDVWMAEKEKHFRDRKKAARKAIADLARKVTFDIDEMSDEYGELMDEIERYYKERIEGWKAALQEVAFLRGFVVNDGFEAEAIGEIVSEIREMIMIKRERRGPHILAEL